MNAPQDVPSLIERAAEMIESAAEALRCSHTNRAGAWVIKCAADREAKQDYAEMVEVAGGLRAALASLQGERDEEAAIREQLAKILAGVAISLNGPEPPLTRWSYHDLPEKALAAVLDEHLALAERDRMREALRRLTFMARTSGGTAGRDEALCAACDEAEAVLRKFSPTPNDGLQREAPKPDADAKRWQMWFADRDGFADKAWNLYRDKQVKDSMLPKQSVHSVRALINAVFDAAQIDAAMGASDEN